MEVDQSAIYAVAGGNHVKIVVDAAQTGGGFDVIEVTAQPGGGPPPHRHAFAEWFHVLEGELQMVIPGSGTLEDGDVVRAGQTCYVPPWAPHATHNTTASIVRFVVAAAPGGMTAYFAEAGVQVPDELTPPARTPPGPAQLMEIARRYEIEWWTPEGWR